MKHKLASDIGRCRPVPNLRSECSVAATAVRTAGTGFLELCVGLSAIFLDFGDMLETTPSRRDIVLGNKGKS